MDSPNVFYVVKSCWRKFRNWRAQIPEDYPFFIGSKLQPGALMVAVHSEALWSKEPFLTKMKSLIRGAWSPSEEELHRLAHETMEQQIFGDDVDFGTLLLKLNQAHGSEDWQIEGLNDSDQRKAAALDAFSIGTRQKLSPWKSNPPLNLQLATRYPMLGVLPLPMLPKVPLRSVKWFVDYHAAYLFAQVRKSDHPQANGIIGYLYEISIVGQKIALGLFNFLSAIEKTLRSKKQALFINAECEAMMAADSLFSYLKAFIEKVVVLLALTHNLTGIDGKKDHKSKVRAIEKGLPARTKSAPYYGFLMAQITPESLETLNSYRNGILHKMGVADLQPHNYVGVSPEDLPFYKVLGTLIEQHAVNSATFICCLALLCDELMDREPADVKAATWSRMQDLMHTLLRDTPVLMTAFRAAYTPDS